jgi:hypothetical protein
MNFGNAQQYTMKSLTINNINAGQSSFDPQGINTMSEGTSQGPVNLYYQAHGANTEMPSASF